MTRPGSTASRPARPNPTEAFLRLIRRQVLARTAARDGEVARGALECDVFPLDPDVAEAADRLARALARIAEPLATLRERLLARLDDEAEDLDEADPQPHRGDRALARPAGARLRCQPGRPCCSALTEPPPDPGTAPGHVLFLR